MMNVIRRIGIGLLLGCVCCTAVWAMDFSRMTNQELADLRGAIPNATQEEQNAFRQEWANRLAAMPEEERKRYALPKEAAPGENEIKFLPYHIMGQGYENQGTNHLLYGGEQPADQGGTKDADR